MDGFPCRQSLSRRVHALLEVPFFDESLSDMVCKTMSLNIHIFNFLCREEINRSYKHMAVLLHPDKNLAPGSDEAFKCIAKAREELLRTRTK